MKHKHCEVIKAWADGAEIEFKSPSKENWECISEPSWLDSNEYRVKPEPKPDVVTEVYIFDSSNGAGLNNNPINPLKNVKLTFDGETNKLKSVEMIGE